MLQTNWQVYRAQSKWSTSAKQNKKNPKNKNFTGWNYRLTTGTSVNRALSLTFFKKQLGALMTNMHRGQPPVPPVSTTGRYQMNEQPCILCPWFYFKPTPGSASHWSPKVIQQQQEGNKRETREGEGGGGEVRWRDEGGQVFQLSLQHLSDQSGCGPYKTLNKLKTAHKLHISCVPVWGPLAGVSWSPLRHAFLSQWWQRDCRSQSHIPVTFIQC